MESTATVVFWLIGVSLSVTCLIFQLLIYLLVPCSRSLDQKILTQLTVARLLNVMFEYLITNVKMMSVPAIRDVTYTLYIQTDAALVCWMFVFTKNLYNKVINVFTKKISFTIMSVTIWLVTLPIGLLCPVILSLMEIKVLHESSFDVYYKAYDIVKFVILTVNLILFCTIFRVAVSRTDRHVGIIRTCLVSFTLLSIASVQVLVTDLVSFFLDDQPAISIIFGVINSYQAIAITMIFVILVNGACEETLMTKITKTICKENV